MRFTLKRVANLIRFGLNPDRVPSKKSDFLYNFACKKNTKCTCWKGISALNLNRGVRGSGGENSGSNQSLDPTNARIRPKKDPQPCGI